MQESDYELGLDHYGQGYSYRDYILMNQV